MLPLMNPSCLKNTAPLLVTFRNSGQVTDMSGKERGIGGNFWSFLRPRSKRIWIAFEVEIIAIFSGVFREEPMEETKDLVEEVLTEANASASLVASTSSTSSKLFMGPWLCSPDLEMMVSSTRQILAGQAPLRKGEKSLKCNNFFN